MKIYVAAKFEEKARVREAHNLLRQAGHTITHDWTTESDEGMNDADRLAYWDKCARADITGVLLCDAVVLFPHDRGKGLYVELGIAIASGKLTVVVGDPKEHGCIFLHVKSLLVCWVPNIETAVEHLR